MNDNREKLVHFLRMLFGVQIIGVLLSALGFLANVVPFSIGEWYNWVQQAVRLGVAVCLFLLPGRYRYAGMAKALSLLCSLVSLVLFQVLDAYGIQLDGISYGRTLAYLSWGASLLNYVALSFEYTTHARIVPSESNKWYILLCATLGISLVSTVALHLLQPLVDQMVQNGSLWMMNLWNIVSRSVSLAFSVVYLVLLYRVVRAQEET